MYITNADFKAIEMAIRLLPEGEEYLKLPKETQDIIRNADVTLMKLQKKKKADNERISAYIADKRKVDKNYAR